METDQLRAFLAVAEEQSFTRAAARLFLTQPALSQRIRELERRVGAPLFTRSARWVRLTATGAGLLEPARSAVDAVADAMAVARQHARAETGRLHVGLFYGGAAELTRPILAAFRRRFPRVELIIKRPHHSTMHVALRAGDLDLAFTRPPLDSPGCDVEDLFEEPIVLAVPASHRLAGAGEVSIADVLDLPLPRLPPWVPPTWLDHWSFATYRNGARPHVVGDAVTTMAECLGRVSSGAVAVPLAASIARSTTMPSGVCLVRLVHAPGSRVSLAARRGSQRPEVQGFVAIAHQVTKSLSSLVDGAVCCRPALPPSSAHSRSRNEPRHVEA